jgi:Ubiquitin-activating enzyme e1 C-terminal domain.
MKFSKLVEHVSKKPIPPHVKHLIVEIMVSDVEGEDVEVCDLHSNLQSQTYRLIQVPFLVVCI